MPQLPVFGVALDGDLDHAIAFVEMVHDLSLVCVVEASANAAERLSVLVCNYNRTKQTILGGSVGEVSDVDNDILKEASRGNS